jgi:hypothetical protein
MKFSGSKNRTIKYPMLGNDSKGDCYLVDALHQIQTWTGNVGTESSFTAADAITRYLALSGGDNGLDDSQIFPAWKSGLLPVNGPHRILDEISVDPHDDAAIRLGMWLTGGCSYTAALLQGWPNAAAPGALWDVGMGSANPSFGHAMHLSGYDFTQSILYYEDETWAMDPAIRLTPAGLKASDPEITLQFSYDMFNAAGYAPHNNMHYTQLAPLWSQLGGITLPASPFPAPAPTPSPIPPPTPSKAWSLAFQSVNGPPAKSYQWTGAGTDSKPAAVSIIVSGKIPNLTVSAHGSAMEEPPTPLVDA